MFPHGHCVGHSSFAILNSMLDFDSLLFPEGKAYVTLFLFL